MIRKAEFKLTEMQTLALDTYKKVPTAFELGDPNEAIREAVRVACGGNWNYYSFMKNQYDVYAIIAEVMPVTLNASLANKFGSFADFKDEAMGDENHFIVEDNAIYPVYTVSRGNGDVERQKISGRSFSVPTQNKEIKFYDEWDRFMSGKIDLSTITDRAGISYLHHIGILIADTIYGSYASVGTDFKATGAYDAATLDGIITEVKAATGSDTLQIWGDSSALGNISDGFGYSDAAKDGANSIGFYDSFRGTPMFSLPQAYLPQTTTLGVNNSHIIILPANEKICKVAFEGVPFVGTNDPMARNDRQIEFVYGRRVGAAAITVPDGKFGFYKFT
jgi:hypothetical protein